jgi:hypothetical protein
MSGEACILEIHSNDPEGPIRVRTHLRCRNPHNALGGDELRGRTSCCSVDACAHAAVAAPAPSCCAGCCASFHHGFNGGGASGASGKAQAERARSWASSTRQSTMNPASNGVTPTSRAFRSSTGETKPRQRRPPAPRRADHASGFHFRASEEVAPPGFQWAPSKRSADEDAEEQSRSPSQRPWYLAWLVSKEPSGFQWKAPGD